MSQPCPCPEDGLVLMGVTISQSSIIITGLIVTTFLVVVYRLVTRRKRYRT